jgi:UDPglucose 6-dehydrogenase
MGLDRRIGREFLNAGIGFGGSCFPKDLSAFIQIAQQLGFDFRLLKEVQSINCAQMDRFYKKIVDTLWVLKDKRLAVLGLAFKQNTDDVRMSPAIELCQRLLREGAYLRVHDPRAMEKSKSVLPASDRVAYVDELENVAAGCDALVVATEWPAFARLNLDRLREQLTHPIVFDGRNLFDKEEMERRGFLYKSVGR